MKTFELPIAANIFLANSFLMTAITKIWWLLVIKHLSRQSTTTVIDIICYRTMAFHVKRNWLDTTIIVKKTDTQSSRLFYSKPKQDFRCVYTMGISHSKRERKHGNTNALFIDCFPATHAKQWHRQSVLGKRDCWQWVLFDENILYLWRPHPCFWLTANRHTSEYWIHWDDARRPEWWRSLTKTLMAIRYTLDPIHRTYRSKKSWLCHYLSKNPKDKNTWKQINNGSQ